MSRCRLIYSSISSKEIVSNDAIKVLVKRSSENNLRDKITGLLLLSGDRFLQVLKGDSKAVNRLYGKIYQDSHHREVELISFELIDVPYFETWGMRLVDLYDLPTHPRQFLMDKYEHLDGDIQISGRLHEVFSLLLDAKALCQSNPPPQDSSTE
ncbi:MAG: BLUF domain-containing protein [Verrucomicrobiota bacterium]